MYPGITLYPDGGAFMFCESISELDPNAQAPVLEPAVAKAKVTQISFNTDPVMEMLGNLQPIYEGVVVPMLGVNYEIEGPAEGIALYNRIAIGMSDIANSIRTELVRVMSLLKMFEEPVDPTLDKFSTHMGFFMKNIERIRRQGIENFSVSWNYLPAFDGTWSLRQLIGSVIAAPELIDDIVAYDIITGRGDQYDKTIGRSFENAIDLLRCLFEDPERMSRLESTANRECSIDSLFRSAREVVTDCVEDCSTNGKKLNTEFLKFLSCNLRKISMTCYDGQCDLSTMTDFTLDASRRKSMQAMLARCVNLFAIGVMICMNLTTRLREHYACKLATDNYVDRLLATLKAV